MSEASIIVEASPVDKIWGVGLAQSDSLIGSAANWQGLNLLGYALMEVRSKLAKR
ncbi:MAG: NADAR domain-containing protein [Marinomonas sp.]